MTRRFFQKLMAWLVMGLILLPLLFFPVTKIRLFTQSQRLAKMMPESVKLESIVFSQAGFQALIFEKNGREFFHEGMLYDVHSIVRTDTTVIVTALKDIRETRLVQPFLSQREPQDQSGPVNQSICFLLYFGVGLFAHHFNPDFLFQDIYQKKNVLYSDPLLSVRWPPPRQLTLS